MRNIFKAAALFAAVGIGAAMAPAQGDDQSQQQYDFRGFTLRGGAVLPIGSDLRDLGTVLIGVGAEFQLPRSFFKRGETYLSADLFVGGTSGDTGYVFPVAINHRIYFANAMGGRRSYYFLGAGLAFINVDDADARLMVRGGLGTELTDRVILETTLTLSDRTEDGTRANSIGVYLGYRF